MTTASPSGKCAMISSRPPVASAAIIEADGFRCRVSGHALRDLGAAAVAQIVRDVGRAERATADRESGARVVVADIDREELRFVGRVKMELAARNVCEVVTPPSVLRSAARAFTNAEIGALLDASAAGRWEAFVAVALATGARRAELLALTWTDIDLNCGAVTSSKALCQVKGRIFTKGTKTNTTRTVPLARFGLDALRRQKARQAAEKLHAGPAYHASIEAPVFTNELGERLTPQAAPDAFRKIALRAGVSSTRMHDLRHTVGSHMLADGVDIRTTASVLGHASPATTIAVYGHVLEGGMRAATDRLGARLEKIRGAQ